MRASAELLGDWYERAVDVSERWWRRVEDWEPRTRSAPGSPLPPRFEVLLSFVLGWSSSYFRELLRLVLSRISAEAGGVLSALKSDHPGCQGDNCLGIHQEATESLQVLVHLLC